MSPTSRSWSTAGCGLPRPLSPRWTGAPRTSDRIVAWQLLNRDPAGKRVPEVTGRRACAGQDRQPRGGEPGAPVASGILAGSRSGSWASIRRQAASGDFSRFRRHPPVVRLTSGGCCGRPSRATIDPTETQRVARSSAHGWLAAEVLEPALFARPMNHCVCSSGPTPESC